MPTSTVSRLSLVALILVLTSCEQSAQQAQAPEEELTGYAAAEFIAGAEQELAALGQHAERMAWVYSTHITGDTEQLSAAANRDYTARAVALAAQAAAFNDVEGIDAVTRRKLDMLRSGIVMPAPNDPAKTAEQAEIGTRLGAMYGKGEYCYATGECLDLAHLGDVMAESRDPAALLEAWNGWRRVSPPMKDLYARQVELANEGAAELGFTDLGAMWRSAYDMPPEDFPPELDRLWNEVKPLYEALHCHVRARLGEQYGTDLVDQSGPIPAHLLGNMWAQDWSNIYPLVAPVETVSSFDLGAILRERGFDAIEMVRTGEAFFSSLGFEELPNTFWQRSQFTRPRDRDVVCHASAWNVDEKDDLRIKMCIKVNAEDFRVIHHELGHNYYQRAYNDKSYLHRDSANDGFHEAVGDTISLSVTPAYLQRIGLLESVPDERGDVALLMKTALEGVAFIPFGLLVDQWRWKVFAGEVGPEGYNQLWWQLREHYQGVAAPIERPADAFDPGAKYHVPGNTPYARYFLARILQYQFHRALCEIAGFEGPVHRCTIYGNAQAGERLQAMLEMGASAPWPDALEALTGQRDMDATAILDYFAPLKGWLDQQNQGRQCGW
jgi:peptidyl-dipeptidase A